MISTNKLEYLKKQIDVVNKKTSFSNLTILNSILFEKKLSTLEKFNKNYFSDQIDLFNTFLSRIEINSIKKNIIFKDIFVSYF